MHFRKRERKKKGCFYFSLSLSADSLLVNTFKDKTDMRYGQILGACTHTHTMKKKEKKEFLHDDIRTDKAN